jgi:hypothetical protein
LRSSPLQIDIFVMQVVLGTLGIREFIRHNYDLPVIF